MKVSQLLLSDLLDLPFHLLEVFLLLLVPKDCRTVPRLTKLPVAVSHLSPLAHLLKDHLKIARVIAELLQDTTTSITE